MKRIPVKISPEDFPSELTPLLDGAKIFDTSSSPEAKVYFIDRDGGYFLKVAKRGALEREVLMTEYFHKIRLGVRILSYISSENDYMLSERAEGEDLTHSEYLSDPKRLAVTMAELLQNLHASDISDCPAFRTPEYLNTVDENYKKGLFDLSLFGEQCSFRSADSAYRFVMENKSQLRSDVLIHGDFCLPNIILKNWRFGKFIDVGNGGIADRHIDLFWGAWTLKYNLGTDDFRELFFDAYGRELINPTALRVVEAAEIFG